MLVDKLWVAVRRSLAASVDRRLTLGCIPQGGDSLLVLVERERKTVDLLLVLHEQERIKVDVAEELHSWPAELSIR